MKIGKVKIEGMIGDHEYFIYVDNMQCSPNYLLHFANHSPDGFCWGYSGSGPAQAALAILLEVLPWRTAMKHYQQFKEDFIAKQDKDKDFTIEVDFDEWLKGMAA